MKVVIVVAFLILSSVAIGNGQEPTPACRKVEIATPGGGYMQRDGTYYVSAMVSHYSGASELTYQWKLPEKPQFTILQDGFGASFVATEELDGLEVKVSLIASEKNGSCRSEATASFQILFNPGTPLIIDDYERLSPRDELVRLDSVALDLRKNDYNALFIVGYKGTDTRESVAGRVRRIVKHLVGKRGIATDRLHFTFYESGKHGVRIYAVKKGQFQPGDAIGDIEKLPIPRRKS